MIMKTTVHSENEKKAGSAGTSDVKSNMASNVNSSAYLEDSEFSKSICSSMDCTGLIPALPSSEAELEAYEEMYQFCFTHTPKES